MAFTDTIKQTAENFVAKNQQFVSSNIKKSDFDRTYVGFVADKVTRGNENGIVKWLVTCGTKSFYIPVGNSNITSVGQRVRIYVPNNKINSVYAEAIEQRNEPDVIKYTANDTTYNDYKSYGEDSSRQITQNDITMDSIVETWNLADKTILEKLYLMTVYKAGEDDEEVTNIITPEGKVIKLSGFTTRE